jgi:hypothetical protein
VAELPKAKVKDEKFDKVVEENICGKVEKFQAKSVVFNSKLNAYVSIKKYDEEKKVYLCKLKNIDDEKDKKEGKKESQ